MVRQARTVYRPSTLLLHFSVACWCTLGLSLSNGHCFAQTSSGRLVLVAAENVSRIGVIQADSGQPMGTCFYCDERGYVATCLSNLSELKDAYAFFDSKTRLRIAGVVAASRGLDIAILQLAEIPSGDGRFQRSLDLRPEYIPQIDEPLLPWSMLDPKQYTAEMVPKIWCRMRGDEYCLGMKNLVAAPYGCRADACWMWLSRPCAIGCNGAPVFNEAGHVVGMISLGPMRQREIYSVLHIQHVIDMIPRDDLKPKSLRTLKTLNDSLPSQDLLTRRSNAFDNLENVLACDLDYGQPLAQRYSTLSRRTELALAERARIEQLLPGLQAQHQKLIEQINELQVQINTMTPEEAYRKTEKDKDSKGNTTEREVVKYRFSARQIALLEPLRAQVAGLKQQSIDVVMRVDFESKMRLPFMKSTIEHLEDEAFYLADPLGLRPSEDHAAFEKSLTTLADSGEDSATLSFVRGMTRVHLRQYKEATADLKTAYDMEPKLRPLCRVLHARMVGLQGAPDKAETALKAVLRDQKDNPRVLALAARVAMDNNASATAVRYLQQAHETMPTQLELQLGLAWTLSQGNTNAKLASESATNVAVRTGYRDWNSLAALANVHMMSGKKEAAVEAIRNAVQSAPAPAQAWCLRWQTQMVGGDPIQRDWK